MALTPDSSTDPGTGSASPSAAARGIRADLSAIAFRAVAKIEAYQLQLEGLAADWRNIALCRSVSAQLEEISGLIGALPQLAVDLVEVAVCHARLLHLLQRHPRGQDLSQLQARQTDAIRYLRRKTLRVITDFAG